MVIYILLIPDFAVEIQFKKYCEGNPDFVFIRFSYYNKIKIINRKSYKHLVAAKQKLFLLKNLG